MIVSYGTNSLFHNEKEDKKIGQKLNGHKKVLELLWERNLGKGILCVVKLAKIGMD